MKKILFSVFAISLLPSLAQATSIDEVSMTQPSCYAREYSEPHMQARSMQTVKKMAVKFSKNEYDTESSMGMEITAFLKKQRVRITPNGEKKTQTVYKPYSNSMFCQKNKNQLHCSIECDGGSADIYWEMRTKNNEITLVNNGFVLYGGCGSDIDENDMIWLKPTKGGDDVFKLYALPAEQCR